MAGFGGSIKLTGETEYQRALKGIVQSLRETSSEMKSVSSSYDKNDKSQTALASKAQVLNKQLEQQKTKLQLMKDEYNRLSESEDENTVAMSKLRTQMNQAQADINKTTKEIDELGKETDDTTKKVKDSGDGFTVFKGILADLGSKAIQSAISGLKKLATATIQVGKQAIESYAEYEQLVGGVETLFKDSADVVEEYANQAYKTAGLSANEYMSTVTSFSASLLQSLGNDTKKAAEYSNRAVIDMSDNANKMGTNIGMIQNAYQGFAKQNYTMLDNLKLGYGGTKTEMQRLIKDASKMNDVQKELNVTVKEGDMSFGNIVNAISVVQKQMGIMGTTSKEAASTIQGSVNSMKASWQNLLTAVADDNKDMGKAIDEFVDSAITAAKNLVPRIKQSVEGIKKLINGIVTEVFPRLKREIPELRPLIETFEWFIKHKTLVVNAVKVMVAAFAIKKLTPFTQTLSDMSQKLLTVAKNMVTTTTAAYANAAATTSNTTAQVALTTAQVAGTTVTKGLTAAWTALSTAFKANPIGLIVTGFTAAVTVFSMFKSKTDELTEAEKEQQRALEEQTDAIEANIDSWNRLKEEKQNTIDAGMTEINHYSSLYDELQGLVDANGNVKKGYEERASFITSTLSDALGIEIDKNKSLSEQIKEIGKSIDEVMEKKKAQIILDSQESLYAEAITKQQEALARLNSAEDNLTKKRTERDKLEAQLAEAKKNKADALEEVTKIQYDTEIRRIEKKIKKNDEETAKYQSNYDKQKNLLSEYAYNIGLYESNMAAAHAGNYDAMSTVTWDYVKGTQKAGDAEKLQLEKQIRTNETNLALLKELKAKSNSDLYDSQIAASEKQLAQLKDSLKKYEEYTALGLDATKVEWDGGLDDILSEITGANIDFKEDGKGNVQMYVDGVKTGKPKSKEEMAKLVSESIKEVSKKDPEAKKAGENLIDGVNNGIKNQNKQSSVFKSIANFGTNLLNNLKKSLKEKSPSKATQQMGEYLMEGLGIGIEKQEDNVLNQISGVGKNVLASMNDELSSNIKLGTIQSNTNSSNNYNSVVNAFKEALGEMKIEMDDETMGKFVDKTVSNIIYT